MATNQAGPENVTNHPGGVSTAYEYQTLGSYPYPDPTKYHQFWDDFDAFRIGYATTPAVNGDWLVTTTGSGTTLVTDATNGIVAFTNSAADDDALFAQWKGGSTTVSETFLWDSTKALWFVARFKVSDATQSDVVMGLQITDTTPLAVTDGLYFLKSDGSTTLNFLATKNSTSTTVAAATMADDTYIKVAFQYLPAGNNGYGGAPICNIWLNDNIVGNTTTFTNFVDDEELAISFGVQNGEAVSKLLSVDYILVGQAR